MERKEHGIEARCNRKSRCVDGVATVQGCWPANPQARAAVSSRSRYTGHSQLGRHVDVDTWLTPRYLLDQLGRFDLDPCAAEENPNWTGASRVLTRVDDGLRSPWAGRVESRVWRSSVWPVASSIFLVHGRTRFCNPDGSATTGRPLRSIALIAWTGEDAEILRALTIAGVLIAGRMGATMNLSPSRQHLSRTPDCSKAKTGMC